MTLNSRKLAFESSRSSILDREIRLMAVSALISSPAITTKMIDARTIAITEFANLEAVRRST